MEVFELVDTEIQLERKIFSPHKKTNKTYPIYLIFTVPAETGQCNGETKSIGSENLTIWF